jgi:PilZ domain
MTVRGRDRGGFLFEESTSSENVCRSGAAFRIRYDVTPGSDLEINIPFAQYTSRRSKTDFATQGRVVHVSGETNGDGRLVGVQFIGPRFNRVFRSEAAL